MLEIFGRPTKFYGYRKAMVVECLIEVDASESDERIFFHHAKKVGGHKDNHIVIAYKADRANDMEFFVAYDDHRFRIGLGVVEGNW